MSMCELAGECVFNGSYESKQFVTHHSSQTRCERKKRLVCKVEEAAAGKARKSKKNEKGLKTAMQRRPLTWVDAKRASCCCFCYTRAPSHRPSLYQLM